MINRSWFTIGLEKYGKHGADPDYYICYRVGYDMRILALILGLIAIVLSIMEANYKFIFNDKSLYEIYMIFVGFTGLPMIFFLSVYLRKFKESVDCKEFDILRIWNKPIELISPAPSYYFLFLVTPFIIFPSLIPMVLYDKVFYTSFHSSLDAAYILIVPYIITAAIQSMAAQIGFAYFLFLKKIKAYR